MKKISYPFFLLMILFGVIFSNTGSLAQSHNGSGKRINKWYDSHEWLNGLSLSPHTSVNKKEFTKQYQSNKAWWDKAFAYLKETDLANLKPGKYPIDGENVFALVTEGPTKDLNQTKWEAHRSYQDIHYVIKGKEQIGIAPVASATIIQAYDAAKDIAFYTAEGNYYPSDPGTFFIVFPEDAHRPGVKADTDHDIKKIVIKVRKGS